jgi:LysM repeat protein
MNRKVVLLASLVAPLAVALPGYAQQSGGAAAPAGNAANPPAAPAAPAAPSQPPGSIALPSANAPDMNAHLPSSAKPSTDLSRSTDSFDLNAGSSGPTVVRGGANNAAILGHEAPTTPSIHVVKRGDTLAEISERYFNTLYNWPKIWSYNPEVQNPNWIYPGDQIRLRPPQAIAGPEAQGGPVTLGGGITMRRPTVAPNTIFLRDQGWIDDPDKDTWGEIAASFEDHMFLSLGDDVYVQIQGDHDVKPGQELAIFRPLRPISTDDTSGEIVSIVGAVKVQKYDPETKVARASVIEAYDAVERGAKVGAVGRRYDVVPIVRNGAEVTAKVLTSLYPHELYGANQVVFIDKGSADGLVPGNRLFVVRKGDNYRATLSGASEFATYDVVYTQNKAVITGGYTGKGLSSGAYPEEVVGEIRVLRTREHTATCIVTNATIEIEPGDTVVARKGY